MSSSGTTPPLSLQPAIRSSPSPISPTCSAACAISAMAMKSGPPSISPRAPVGSTSAIICPSSPASISPASPWISTHTSCASLSSSTRFSRSTDAHRTRNFQPISGGASANKDFRRFTVKKLKVLIVDDSSVMRKIVERALRQAGLDINEVAEASNGAEALAEIQKGVPDMILSDINMPVMDGLEFLKNLATLDSAKGVPVIMITTEGSEARVVEALSAGAKGYLRKPFTPEQVKERVAPLIGGVS